ncbi:MAG: 50S ribosomal protein L18e [Candidatus Micrarchaeota archaeon]
MKNRIENQELRKLIALLRTSAKKGKIWDRVADLLEKPVRKKHPVSFTRLNYVTKKGETVVLASKLLATGELKHELTIACFNASKKAAGKTKIITIKELIEKNPSGKNVRIIV